ncbi:MAG: hypothetical protein CVU39_21185 [Chloroflexi bacterium HGW-Chloroflexi-10]|nr:MAG: hypothetical protein CVU39_21185 [Chloroflexi bacterium HGW-Chloroflexi-10]
MEKYVKKNLLIFLASLSIIEASWFFYNLILLEKDPQNVLFLGFSGNRLLLMAVIFFVIFISVWFLIKQIKNHPVQLLAKFEEWFKKHSITSMIFGFVFLIGIWGTSYLLWAYFNDTYSAILNRIGPVVLLYLIIFTQIVVYLLLFNKNILMIINNIYQGIDKKKTGYLLLVISFLVGLVTLNITLYNHTDEGDVLSIGWLLSEGYVLYKDVFSHHFPLPYYWVGLIIKIFGSSVVIIRLSFLILKTIIFFVAMKNSRFYLSIGLTAITWNAISFLYLGNMLLYDSFAGLFLILAFSIVLAHLLKKIELSPKQLIIIGLSLSFAFLSDPTKVFPGIVICLSLAIEVCVKYGVFGKITWKKIGYLIISGLFPIVVFILVLILYQTFDDFRVFVIEFNSNIYSKYSGQISIYYFINQLKKGFEIFNPIWRENLNPVYFWDEYLRIDHSIYTGLFYRVAVWSSILYLSIKKKYFTAIMIFIYVASNLIRATEAFHASPFVLLSIFLATIIIEDILLTEKEIYKINVYNQSLKSNILKIGQSLIIFIFLLNIFWLNFRSTDYFLKNISDLTYQGNFTKFEIDAEETHLLSCNLDEVKFLFYPVYPEVHFWGKLRPITKYLFLLPWVVDAFEEDIIADLSKTTYPSLVFINKSVCVWNLYCVDDYASNIIEYLDEKYIQLSDYYYASPALLDICDVNIE